jgi:hypothetical protein
VLLTADDGIVGVNMRAGAQDKAGVTADGKSIIHKTPSAKIVRRISEGDLLDWLGRHHPARAAAPPKPRPRNKRARVDSAIRAMWGDALPGAEILSNSALCKQVSDWLKADSKKQNVPAEIPSDDTILRAAGRK